MPSTRPSPPSTPLTSGIPGPPPWLLVAALSLITAAVRGVLARVIGLSVDESYAVVMGRHLQLSYYDHPPLTFWMAGLAARLAGTEAPLVVRGPFILGFALTTWLLYRLAAFLFGEAAGVWTAVLLNLVLFFTLP
ncbi:MAG TPA: glycosyltransferase family 39 protein, partial [Vicinamibacteria bacterium]|nr:glycosyltransferase family 39 protein [Vicinamibacteria bacterium]